jgi:hypothetical protein
MKLMPAVAILSWQSPKSLQVIRTQPIRQKRDGFPLLLSIVKLIEEGPRQQQWRQGAKYGFLLAQWQLSKYNLMFAKSLNLCQAMLFVPRQAR